MKLGLVLLCVVIPEMYTLQRYLEKLGLSSLASCFFGGEIKLFTSSFRGWSGIPRQCLLPLCLGFALSLFKHSDHFQPGDYFNKIQ